MDNISRVIANRYRFICGRIAVAAETAGRNPADIAIVGVSKKHPPQTVAAGVIAGIHHIGENRVQEAAAKIPVVKEMLHAAGFDPSRVTWHMVGNLQSNKAAQAARLFDVVHSLYSYRCAERLARAASGLGKVMRVYIEVNTSPETAKFALAPA